VTEERQVQLFPLNTVLFPGGPLPLRIFEPRYLDLVSHCLKEGEDFGIALIRDGQETGKAALTYSTGTLAKITDWHQRHDGLLGITVQGGRRFEILSSTVEFNQLTRAEIRLLESCRRVDLPPEYYPLSDIARQLIERIGHYYADLKMQYDDAAWVGYRLAELLPLDLTQKQQLLEMTDPIVRLDFITALLDRMEE